MPTPPVWVFAPDETLAKTISNYATKDEFFRALTTVLADHSDYAANTDDEQAIIDAAVADSPSREALTAGAHVAEELGEYRQARAHYASIVKAEQADAIAADALLALARLNRYSTVWSDAAKRLDALERLTGETDRFGVAADIAMERGYALHARQQWAEARDMLEAAIIANPTARRMGELRFYAGVAHYRLGEKAWAHYHWCWLMKNLPDDHLYMRCYIAITADAMPYRNPELGNRPRGGMITHALADRARANAFADFDRLNDEFGKPDGDGDADDGDSDEAAPDSGPQPDTDDGEDFERCVNIGFGGGAGTLARAAASRKASR